MRVANTFCLPFASQNYLQILKCPHKHLYIKALNFQIGYLLCRQLVSAIIRYPWITLALFPIQESNQLHTNMLIHAIFIFTVLNDQTCQNKISSIISFWDFPRIDFGDPPFPFIIWQKSLYKETGSFVFREPPPSKSGKTFSFGH